MSRDLLFQNLKAIKKTVQPDPEFLRRSKNLILSSSQKPTYLFQTRSMLGDSLKLTVALGLMSLLVFVLAGGLNPRNSNILTSLNEKALRRESARVSFNIELDEISYREEIEKNIASALDEIINR